MSIRVILAVVGGQPQDRAVLAAAAAIGRRDGALVRVLPLIPDPAWAATFAGPEMGIAIDQVIAAAMAEADQALARAAAAFDAWVEQEGIAAGAPGAFGAAFVRHETRGWGMLATLGPLADLVILGRDEALVSLERIETALFETGRPILLVPGALPADLLACVVVSWKPSPPAAHALSGAMPLLQRAGEVRVFAARDDDEANPADVEDLRDYLGRHGVRATSADVPAGAGSIGDALLRAADRAGASLVVLGGYSHSRFRELILGGVTKHVLQKARVPLLMAH